MSSAWIASEVDGRKPLLLQRLLQAAAEAGDDDLVDLASPRLGVCLARQADAQGKHGRAAHQAAQAELA